MRYRLFQKTESLITADGSDDDLIKPESLTNYKILPPVLYPQSAAPISSIGIINRLHQFQDRESKRGGVNETYLIYLVTLYFD